MMGTLKTLSAAALAMVIMFAAGITKADAQTKRDDRIQYEYGQTDLVRILKSEGYASVERHDSDGVTFKIEGKIYGLFIMKDNDLKLYYGTSGIEVSLSTLNTWNRDFRHSRAFNDNEGDPILEADLLADKGLTEAMVKNFIAVFTVSVARFRKDVLKE